jgi:uncharacterized membrane protein
MSARACRREVVIFSIAEAASSTDGLHMSCHVRNALRCAISGLYIIAGIFHLLIPSPFVLITPDWVPYPPLAVAITGMCEIAGGVGLLIPRLQRAAGFMLSVYAVCVFPANLKHAFQGMHVQSLPDGWWYHAPRLALQPVLVWLPLYSTSLIDWPFGSNRHDPPE